MTEIAEKRSGLCRKLFLFHQSNAPVYNSSVAIEKISELWSKLHALFLVPSTFANERIGNITGKVRTLIGYVEVRENSKKKNVSFLQQMKPVKRTYYKCKFVSLTLLYTIPFKIVLKRIVTNRKATFCILYKRNNAFTDRANVYNSNKKKIARISTDEYFTTIRSRRLEMDSSKKC